MVSKVLLIGWDAADWKMIYPLMNHGLMPNMKKFVERGTTGNLTTLSPVLSPMLWTSIATGKRPFKHGILGFTEPTADGTAVQPITNLTRKTKAIWNILNQNDKRSLVVAWWPSHPAEAINGVMVSNHYHEAPKTTDPHWPMMPGTVHPPELAQELAEIRVHPLELGPEHLLPFVPHADRVDQSKDKRLDSILKVIAHCSSVQSAATHLLETEAWDFAGVYFDAIDHFGHGFMKYHPPRQKFVSEEDFEIYQNVVSAGYVYHDMMLGRLLALAGEDTNVIIVSDHGFHPDNLRPSAIPVEPAGPAVEHRDLGIVAMYGPDIKPKHVIQGASLLDITPTVLQLFGLPMGADMDGKPLLDALIDPGVAQMIPSWDEVVGDDGQHPPERKLDTQESQESVEQLAALGYIEPVAKDQKQAVAQTVRELDYNLALSYMDGNQYGQAAPILARLYRDYPLEFRFGVRLALCLYTLGMTDAMARLVDNINVRWRKASQRAKLRLAEINQVAQQRRLEKEEQAAAKVSPESETSATASDEVEAELRAQANDLFNDGEKRVLRQLQSIAKGSEQLLDYLGSLVALARQDSAATLVQLEKIARSDKLGPGLQTHLGNTYLELKQFEQAEACYQKALALDPENPNAQLGLCRCYLPQHRVGEALQAATAAVGLKYQFAPAHYFLGIAHRRSGHVEAAVMALEEAVSQNPNFLEAHLRLSVILRKQGDRSRAMAHRKTARTIWQQRQGADQSPDILELPDLDEALIDESLPELPKLEESQQLRSLAMAPQPRQPREGEDEVKPLITVVSGLPRSGTSMMMQMLAAGGLPPLTDEAREADENNPRGYFELDRVKRLPQDNHWLGEAEGKVIKVVAPLLPFLPQDFNYKVVFMQRELTEIVASQTRMLARLQQQGGDLEAERLRAILERQVQQAQQIVTVHQIPLLEVDYAQTLKAPQAAVEQLMDFLGLTLDQKAMVQVVDPTLYRERSDPDTVTS